METKKDIVWKRDSYNSAVAVTSTKKSESPSTPCCVANSWDVVTLKNHTDIYRVYTLNGVKIYCGINSDTVRTENDAEVSSIFEKAT